MGLKLYINNCNNIEELRAIALKLLKYKKKYKRLSKEFESIDTRPAFYTDPNIKPKI